MRLFRQLFDFETSTFTYLLADSDAREAILIDSLKEQAERDIQLIKDLQLKLLYVLDTHVHADHITGAACIKKATGAKIVFPKPSQIEGADILIQDGQKLQFGCYTLKAIATPGHTKSCTCYMVEDCIFTGDTLLIRGCGRTDFQEGCPETLYESVTKKLFKLPPKTTVYPGHDYKGRTASSIFEEKEYNPRLGKGKSKSDFVKIMNSLDLTYPEKIDVAVPANLKAGDEG